MNNLFAKDLIIYQRQIPGIIYSRNNKKPWRIELWNLYYDDHGCK
jgi:hypothetical protein